MAQAIAQKADAIVLLGIEPAMLSGSLNDAARAGIPVINALSGDASAPLANRVFANVSADYTADGASLAAWTLVDSNCSASTFFAQPTAIEIYQNMANGAEKVYRENCPDDCSLDIQEIDLANAATDLPQKVETAMKRNPDTTYVMTNWDSGRHLRRADRRHDQPRRQDPRPRRHRHQPRLDPLGQGPGRHHGGRRRRGSAG